MRAYLIVVPGLLALSGFGPGYLLIRRLDWSAAEKITASIALSLVFLYLACFGVFVLDLPRAAHAAILLACAGLTLAAARGAPPLFADPEVRRLVGGLGLLAFCVLTLLALIRIYSGGTWYGDWLEHYQRSQFFLGGHDPAVTFQGYALPARPPLVNVLAAHFLALAGDRFRVYQLVSSLLALLAYFPACLLGGLASRSGRIAYGVLAAFLMFNPMFVQNATYSWTKLPAAFFVLCGTYFYVMGCRRQDPRRTLLAFSALAAGVLAHYSACPYALFLLLHYLLFVFPARPSRWKELAAIGACWVLISGSWLGWSAATYGGRATLTSASSVRDRAGLSAHESLRIVARNLRDTLVPHLARPARPGQPDDGLGWIGLRDILFNNYQQNLFLGLGVLGSALLLYEIVRSRGAPGGGPAGPRFWACFASFNVLAGTAAHATEASLGLAHVALQPLVILGIAFLASRFIEWSRPVQWLAVAGLAIDGALGVALHFWLQSLPPGAAGLAEGNWTLQQARATVFVGSDLRAWAWLIRPLAAAALALGFLILVRQIRRAPGPRAGPVSR